MRIERVLDELSQELESERQVHEKIAEAAILAIKETRNTVTAVVFCRHHNPEFGSYTFD